MQMSRIVIFSGNEIEVKSRATLYTERAKKLGKVVRRLVPGELADTVSFRHYLEDGTEAIGEDENEAFCIILRVST
jgi:hypothetical protein